MPVKPNAVTKLLAPLIKGKINLLAASLVGESANPLTLVDAKAILKGKYWFSVPTAIAVGKVVGLHPSVLLAAQVEDDLSAHGVTPYTAPAAVKAAAPKKAKDTSPAKSSRDRPTLPPAGFQRSKG